MKTLDDLAHVLFMVLNRAASPEEGQSALRSFIEANRDDELFVMAWKTMSSYRESPEELLNNLLEQADDFELVAAYGQGIVPQSLAAQRYWSAPPFEQGLILSYDGRGIETPSQVRAEEFIEALLYEGPEPTRGKSASFAGVVTPNGTIIVREAVFRQYRDH